ncbi:hypothetical protein,Zinc finger DHHC domain containing transmembrane protein, putative [Trypanosoma cruzi]|nr:hypothetical protein,Zinc finger DHHC domain containing transmembrane protein, putative [Trypanosoma cruzi]
MSGETFACVALVITAVAAFMYIVIMGPSRYHRDGIVGRMYFCLLDCPTACCGCFCGICFGCSYRRGRQKWTRCSDHTFRERNWFMVIFYILLVWSVEFLYLFIALPELQVSIWFKLISYGLVMVSEGFYALAVFSDPGIVTSREEKEAQQFAFAAPPAKNKKHKKKRGEENAAASNCGHVTTHTNAHSDTTMGNGEKWRKGKMRQFLLSPEAEARQNRKYIVDGILYAMDGSSVGGNTARNLSSSSSAVSSITTTATGLECSTCHVPRPSRSKHCRLCDYCVRRYDHHCPWINNDVAEGTHRWFLLFIICHAISCLWAAWDMYALMKAFLVQNRAWGWSITLANGLPYFLTPIDYLIILVTYQTIAACLFFFSSMIGLVLLIFGGYQMSFVFDNLTMNDMGKIDDAITFVLSLPSLDEVYREAMNVWQCLEVVAARPPRKLRQLKPPPPEFVPGSRGDKSYRKKVQKMLYSDLKGLFDRGVWNNLVEVFFPYSHERKRDRVGRTEGERRMKYE